MFIKKLLILSIVIFLTLSSFAANKAGIENKVNIISGKSFAALMHSHAANHKNWGKHHNSKSKSNEETAPKWSYWY